MSDNIDIQHVVCDLNLLFKDANLDIKHLLDEQNIFTRTRKLLFKTALKYKFLCALKNNTNQQIASDLCYINEIFVNDSSYYRKEQKIPLQYYQNVLGKTRLLFDKYNKKYNKYIVIAGDGTYNNTNLKRDKTLETSLNMGYYNVTDAIPIGIDFKGNIINKEIESLTSYISDNHIDIKNVILVLDRAYFSYTLFKFLEDKHIKFVIRVKNNCVYLKDKKPKKNNNDVRFVSYNVDILETKKDKNGNDKSLKRKLSCYLATNLDLTFDDETIKNMYKSRWDIEVFFKLVKSNFRFSYLTEHNGQTKECYEKTICAIQIFFLLERLFELLMPKPKQNNKYTIKYNKSLALKGIKQLIPYIIDTTLTTKMLSNYLSTYFKKVRCEKNKSNPRISKRPFTKWYVKHYSNFYKYAKIIDCIENDTIDTLNKNLKLEALNIQILQ